MVHAAIHDAVQAYEKRFKPYRVRIRGASGSPVAAVAKAARDVLVERFPGQAASIHAQYLAYLSSKGLTEEDGGVLVGQQAADAIIADRAGDGSNPVPPPINLGKTKPGQWRPTPPALLPFSAVWLGRVPPFTMTSPRQFRARPHPSLKSDEYAIDYNEVQAFGGPVGYPGVIRDADQTQLAYFYSDNTIALMERTLRGIVADANFADHFKELGDSARLFALANLAAANAGIAAWDSKKYYNLWRPITAIQEGDNDKNGGTTGDPAWTSLITTPPYPDYTSGANNVVGSMTRILALYFEDDDKTFKVTSNAALANPKERTYHSFSAMADDVVDVRVYQGIHFRFADTAGRRQGTGIATQAFNHFLRPVDDDDDDDDH